MVPLCWYEVWEFATICEDDKLFVTEFVARGKVINIDEIGEAVNYILADKLKGFFPYPACVDSVQIHVAYRQNC